jgi:hypothetical protein
VSGRRTRRYRRWTGRGSRRRRRRSCCLSGRDKFLRRRVRWRRGFRPDFGPGTFRSGTIGNGGPAVVDVDFGDAFLHSARPNNIASFAQHRNRNFELAAGDPRLPLRIGVTAQPVALDRLLAARTQFVIARSFVHDRRVRKSDPGDVLRLDDDVDVPLRGNHGPTNVLGTEIVGRDERVLIRADVVVTVRPILDSAASIEPGFGRQRRPAHVILARPPRHPGRRPFFTRHPNPTDPTQPDPAAIMIGRPTEFLVRHPSPAGVAVNPTAFRVGSPIA